MISQILSFGYLPAVVLTGYWIVSNPLNTTSLQLGSLGRIGISFTIGLLLWFPLLFLAAWGNAFNPDWIGAAGWVVSLFFVLKLKEAIKVECEELRSSQCLGVLAFATALFVFNGLFTSESILGGRDQGVYSNHGAHIAKTGMLRSEPPYEKLYEPVNYRIAGPTNPNGFVYDLPKGDMYIQFPPTLAIHLAQFFGVGGYEGLLLFNPLVASFSVLLFLGLSSLFLERRWAYLATCLFALNASQVWNARITLSEIVAQNLILGGLALAVASYRNCHRLGYTAACMIAASAALARIDGFIIAPSLITANLALYLYSSSPPNRSKMLVSGSAGAVAIAVMAYLFNLLTSPIYFLDFTVEVGSLIALSVTGFVLHLLVEKSSKLRRAFSFVESPGFLNRVVLLLALLVVYGFFIRPHIEPFSQFENSHYGTRNYRENSLIDLSKYVSLPLLFLAPFGACVAILGFRKKRTTDILIILVPWFAFSLLYLYDPRISTDHIFRIRRFTPLVIPGFILFGFWGITYLVNKYSNDIFSKYVYGTSIVASCLFLYTSLKPIAFLKQYEGSLDTIRSISNALPEGALTLANVSSEILGPLQLAEGHKMIRDHLDAKSLSPVVSDIIEHELERGRDVYFLSEIPQTESFYSVPVGNWQHHIPRLERTPIAPARKVHTQKRNLYLSQLTGSFQRLSPDQSYFSFGGTKTLNVDESGLYGQETIGEVPFRWTNGDAKFGIKTSFSRDPIKLILTVHATKPIGSKVSILANGSPVFNGTITQENLVITSNLEGIDFLEANNEILVKSDSWIPSEHSAQSTDTRELGIAIRDITIMFDESIRFGSTRFGNVPVKGIEESGLYPVESIDNRSIRWTKGHATFSFELHDGFKPKAIELDVAGVMQNQRVLMVKWNGQVIHEGPLNPNLESLTLPLESTHSGRNAKLEVICDPFIPSELGLNSDGRRLGLQIAGIRLK